MFSEVTNYLILTHGYNLYKRTERKLLSLILPLKVTIKRVIDNCKN